MSMMKLKWLVLLLFVSPASAQLVITQGTQFSINGNIRLTLRNADLVNNGSLISGNSVISFIGDAASSISGSQPVEFFGIELNKTNNSSVNLQSHINVKERALFTSGFLDLNGFNTDLGTTGHLDGEKETSRVIGPDGGEVLFNTNLNAPTGSNPANLGIFITTNENLGDITIKRGHQSQEINPGAGSVFRYFEILPANNTNLNAGLRFKYFNGELNGLDENSLVLFKNENGTTWTDLGFTSRDTNTNFVEQNNITGLGRFTLSSSNSILPVRFIQFTANCQENKVVIRWKTAQEVNSSHFNIERSHDGINWEVIGRVGATGNRTTETSYFFTGNNPGQNDFYRIAEFDIDGSVQFTSVIRATCNITEVFKLSPNPFHDIVFINIFTDKQSHMRIKVLDSKGSLVKLQELSVLQGNNRFRIDLRSLVNGIYLIQAEWNNGQSRKTVQVIKQH